VTRDKVPEHNDRVEICVWTSDSRFPSHELQVTSHGPFHHRGHRQGPGVSAGEEQNQTIFML